MADIGAFSFFISSKPSRARLQRTTFILWLGGIARSRSRARRFGPMGNATRAMGKASEKTRPPAKAAYHSGFDATALDLHKAFRLAD